MTKSKPGQLLGSPSTASPPILSVENVTKRYGKFLALENISLNLAQGNHVLILGPNGAGKTTLIRCIMDLVSFDGRISVDGVNVKRDSSAAKDHIGYVPQNYAFYEGITVKDHAILSTRLKNTARSEAEEKLKYVDLWNVKDKKVRALSDGMKQRLGIALAMIGNPPLLLLDEPTSNVDLRGQLEFQSLLKTLLKSGKSLLTTTHLTGLGELATQVVILDRGKVIGQGAPDILLKNMGVNDTLYMRVKQENSQANVIRLLEAEGAIEVSSDGEWITASVPSSIKLKLVKDLLNSSEEIDDLLVERSKIEAEYVKLIQRSRNN
ncbi:MAG TPA: ABC transporter ATP-binding protein [Nitrososphaerales archaeon]|nr:ABC transporter ATP-binding protein [Nitrososphaerales archaeon]